MQIARSNNSWLSKLARAGLIAKGMVYVILGILGFMAAFEIGGTTNDDTNKTGALVSIKELPGGLIILVLLVIGLICYSGWRLIQSFAGSSNAETKWTKRVRYFWSAIIYLLLAATALQMIFLNRNGKGHQDQYWVSRILQHPSGQFIITLAGIVLAAIGVYQIYYGLSEKYRKHVQELNTHGSKSKFLLTSGKIGYIARGVVWIIIGYLFFLAGLHKNSAEAGDTGKAFGFIENSAFGSYLLGALGLGLIAYGIFNFIRARYETFK